MAECLPNKFESLGSIPSIRVRERKKIEDIKLHPPFQILLVSLCIFFANTYLKIHKPGAYVVSSLIRQRQEAQEYKANLGHINVFEAILDYNETPISKEISDSCHYNHTSSLYINNSHHLTLWYLDVDNHKQCTAIAI